MTARADTATAVLLDQVIEELYAKHTVDVEVAAQARREYEERRGRVHQDDELWEAWSDAFVEWFVVERVAPGHAVPLAALTYRAMLADEAALSASERAKLPVIAALVTSQRSLYEVRAMSKGHVELLDLLGGAVFSVDEMRALHGVEIGDVAELRLVGIHGEVRFGRTFVYHPKAARAAIVERARALLSKGSPRRDVIDHVAHLRVQVTRYRHMAPARVYELGSRIMG